MAAWALVIERTIAALRPGLARFMIGENVATVVPWTPLTDVEFNRPPAAALVSLLAYLAVIVSIATASFRPKRHQRHLTRELGGRDALIAALERAVTFGPFPGR